MRHARKDESLWRLYVERSDSTQIFLRNWWNIGGTVWTIGGSWWTIGGNWLVEHKTCGILFFMVFLVVSTSSTIGGIGGTLVEHWWTIVGQIRGARIEKHFVQH